jgi:hypothetical protein
MPLTNGAIRAPFGARRKKRPEKLTRALVIITRAVWHEVMREYVLQIMTRQPEFFPEGKFNFLLLPAFFILTILQVIVDILPRWRNW